MVIRFFILMCLIQFYFVAENTHYSAKKQMHRTIFIKKKRKKTCLPGFANNKGTNNKGADQTAHPRSLVSALVFRFLKSIISKLATCEFSTF